jgi:hypothetical protein
MNNPANVNHLHLNVDEESTLRKMNKLYNMGVVATDNRMFPACGRGGNRSEGECAVTETVLETVT